MLIVPKGQANPPMPAIQLQPRHPSPAGNSSLNNPPVNLPVVPQQAPVFQGGGHSSLSKAQPVGSDEGCFTKMLSSRFCLAAAGCIAAGVLFLKRKFGKNPAPSLLPSPRNQQRQANRASSPSPRDVVLPMSPPMQRHTTDPLDHSTTTELTSHNPFIPQGDQPASEESQSIAPLHDSPLIPFTPAPTESPRQPIANEAASSHPRAQTPVPVEHKTDSDDDLSSPDAWTVIDGPEDADTPTTSKPKQE